MWISLFDNTTQTWEKSKLAMMSVQNIYLKKSSYKNARFWVSANVKSSKAMMSRLAIFLFPGARRRQEEEMWAKKPLPTLPIAFCAPFSRHPDNGRSGILVILSKVTHQEFSFLLLQDSIESLTTFLFLALREFLAVK